MSITEQLRSLIRQSGVSLDFLARELLIAHSAIAEFMAGKNSLTLDQFESLAGFAMLSGVKRTAEAKKSQLSPKWNFYFKIDLGAGRSLDYGAPIGRQMEFLENVTFQRRPQDLLMVAVDGSSPFYSSDSLVVATTNFDLSLHLSTILIPSNARSEADFYRITALAWRDSAIEQNDRIGFHHVMDGWGPLLHETAMLQLIESWSADLDGADDRQLPGLIQEEILFQHQMHYSKLPGGFAKFRAQSLKMIEAEVVRNASPSALIVAPDLSMHEIVDNEWEIDAQWALQQWQDGAFDGREEEYVAVYQKEARGFGNDPNQLRDNVSATCGVLRERIIVKYIGSED